MECLKQFRNILFGYENHVYSDHKNLIYKGIFSNMRRHKLSNLDLTNQAIKDGTPVMLASVYKPNNDHKIIEEHLLVLIDSE